MMWYSTALLKTLHWFETLMLNLFLNNVEDMQFKGIKSYLSRFLVRIPLKVKPQAKPAFYLKHIFGCKCNVNTCKALTSALIQKKLKIKKKLVNLVPTDQLRSVGTSSNGNQIIKLHCSQFTGQFSGNAKLHMLKDIDARRNRRLYKHTRVISLNKIS